MRRITNSRFFDDLNTRYALAPSITLWRTAEAEILREVNFREPCLDLCCGDGYFASLLFPHGLQAGCDISVRAVNAARERGLYGQVEQADITRRIPWPESSFRTVISSSSLEHVADIDAALGEVSRVLKPNGRLVATFASDYAYEWWPCGPKAMQEYTHFQPVYNRMSLGEWTGRLAATGLRVIEHRYYFSKAATRFAMWLDYHFSRAYLTNDWCLERPIVRLLVPRIPLRALTLIWSAVLSTVSLQPTEAGGGLLIVAQKV